MDSSFEVMPHQGFGALRLGADRNGVRRLLGDGVASVHEFGAASQDHFFAAGAVVGYDSTERVISAVITSPAQVSHRGIELLGHRCGELQSRRSSEGCVSSSVRPSCCSPMTDSLHGQRDLVTTRCRLSLWRCLVEARREGNGCGKYGQTMSPVGDLNMRVTAPS